MTVHVIGPDGKEYGPFENRIEAQKFGFDKWPSICDDPDENQCCWQVIVSTMDSVVSRASHYS